MIEVPRKSEDVPDVVYVVMALHDWSDLELPTPTRINLGADAALGDGFLSVYFDHGEACEHADGAPVLALHPLRKPGERSKDERS